MALRNFRRGQTDDVGFVREACRRLSRTWVQRGGGTVAISRLYSFLLAALAAALIFPADAGARSLRLTDATIARGQSNCLSIVFAADGGENALGFSVCFDTNLVSFVSARRGAAASAASFSVNTNQLTRGRVGIAMALPAGEFFSAGDNPIIELCLRAAPGGGVVTTPLSLCDFPLARDVVDVDANSVVATFTNSVLTLVGGCTYALQTAGGSFLSAGGDAAVGVVADAGCAWSAASATPWVTVTGGAGGVGPGAVSYNVAANPGYDVRTGQVIIAGQTFNVIQAGIPCTFSLNLAQRTHGPASEFHFFEVTATAGCNWTVENTNSWITLTSPSSWVGNGRVDYWVGANGSGLQRTGIVRVANQVFTIHQLGYTCTYGLSPISRIHTAVSESAIVNVTAPDGCAWYVVNTNDWMIIKLYTNGVGSDIVRYTVFPNPYPRARSGVLTIGGQPFTVHQVAAPCNYTLLQTSQFYGPGGYSDAVSLATLNECTWTASTPNNWIVLSNTAGVGGGQIRYYVAPNWTSADRVGTIRIANQTLTLTQLGTPCSYSISPSSRSVTSSSATGSVSVSVSTGGGVGGTNQICYWTAINTNSWITVYQPPAPWGNGSFTYSIAPNNFGAARSGNITVGGRTFAVSQAGIPCTYSVSPTSRSHTYGVETGLVAVTAVNGCVWTARPNAAWITMTSPTNGVGSGSIAYRVALNTGAARSATITVGSATFTINQGAATAVSITTQPAARNVGHGSNVAFTVAAAGTAPLTYQWRFNGTNNLVNGPGVSGATSATLIVSNVQHVHSGNYSVVVGNLRGSVTSANAALLVNTPPALSPIAGRATVRGNLVTFTATATDLQAPPQTFTYSLGPGAPSGAAINASSGVFTWTPSASQAIAGYPITVRVSDNGTPPFTNETATTISVFAGYTTNVTFVSTGSVWGYRDTGENLGTAWTGLAYNDSLWAAGPGPLGYGNDTEATIVSWGPDEDDKFVTTYFRRKFSVANPAAFTALALRLKRDDGAVVHLNGTELYRNNMPAGAINYLTFASVSVGGDDEEIYVPVSNLDPGRLVAGENVVAVEVHQRNVTNSDLGFDLELTGRMTVFTGGTPTPLAQPPRIRIALAAGGEVEISWDAAPARRYRVQYATDIAEPVWRTLGGDVLSTSTTAAAVDESTFSAQRFYRVLALD